MALVIEKDVQDWDLSTYPEEGRDPRDGKVGSTWYKLQYLTKDGMVDQKTFKQTQPMNILNAQGVVETVQQVVERKGGRRECAITGGIGSSGAKKDLQGFPTSKIEPVDLKKAEQEIQGKPTLVLMGLFWKPRFDEDGQLLEWVPQDRKKTIMPLFWRDVTEDYYQIWRPEAYKTGVGVDPFKNMQRPYTRLQEINQTAHSREQELLDKIAELEKKAKK